MNIQHMNIDIETKYKQNQKICSNKTFQEIKVNIECHITFSKKIWDTSNQIRDMRNRITQKESHKASHTYPKSIHSEISCADNFLVCSLIVYQLDVNFFVWVSQWLIILVSNKNSHIDTGRLV